MTRGDLFNINACICAELATFIALNAPEATVLVISNPVNSTVAVFKEIFVKHGVFDAKKLFGVTALDHVRSNTFLSELIEGTLPQHYDIPVILNDENILDALIHRVQYGGDEVVEAKQGKGSSTLSMAYAANKFFNIVLNGYLNLKQTELASYIYLDNAIPGVTELKRDLKPLLDAQHLDMPEFLATPMTYGPEGVATVDYTWVNAMNNKEREMFYIATGFINQNVEKGVSFVKA
ncbi:hypothetical protein PMKS-002504 [Pichia membranifaciens]|uniref:malate dehydrogenase n=1 Tax=Pichia membranifaciens TaxID=4926 RepID=A0A1Q2YHN8_9ASCO|nr:hypothetical protein PMKS-002504 [Pichia membranifaciens]